MAKFCGGINLDPKFFKIIDGVICTNGGPEEDFDVNTISTCGQLWDGRIFALRDGVITFANSYYQHPPVPIKGNCGIGLDGLYFKLFNGCVTGVSRDLCGLLTVNVTPADATIKVIDVNGDEWSPIAGTNNIFVLTKAGTYKVVVSKTGYITKTETVRIDNVDHIEQTIEVTLEAAG